MTEDMVTRVAMAMYYAPMPPGVAVTDNIPPLWERLDDEYRQFWHAKARAAISSHLTALKEAGYVVMKQSDLDELPEKTANEVVARIMAATSPKEG